MKRSTGKALYIFLASLLGIILFGVFHRALVVIYYLMQDGYYFNLKIQMSQADLQALDFFTMLVALFLGGWYGVWLGLHWYELVYEGEHRAGLFHGFIPHHFRKGERARRAAAKSSSTEKAVHVPVVERPSFEKITDMKSSLPWDLDDLDGDDVKVVRKTVRKKVVRKAAPKRVRKTEAV